MFSIHKKEINATNDLSHALSKRLKKVHQEIVMICIGTDRSSGDSLGPLVGSQLSSFEGFHVYGTLEHPVHAKNLEKTIDTVNKHHPNAFIISIDACLGKMESIGEVRLKEGPLKPGEGVGTELPPVGDISITGIVNLDGGSSPFVTLLTTRLFDVMELSTIISNALYTSLRKKQRSAQFSA
jgi:putative sporulation protein YyaC